MRGVTFLPVFIGSMPKKPEPVASGKRNQEKISLFGDRKPFRQFP